MERRFISFCRETKYYVSSSSKSMFDIYNFSLVTRTPAGRTIPYARDTLQAQLKLLEINPKRRARQAHKSSEVGMKDQKLANGVYPTQ
jgi:hypothetical protein